MEWRHNDKNERWELGYQDIDRDVFIVRAAVSDELLSCAISQEQVVGIIKEEYGSVPPPWEQYVSTAKNASQKKNVVVTEEMVTIASNVLWSEAYPPHQAYASDFTRAEIDAGKLRQADDECTEKNRALVRRALEAAVSK